jgi:hypothetical protein
MVHLTYSLRFIDAFVDELDLAAAGFARVPTDMSGVLRCGVTELARPHCSAEEIGIELLSVVFLCHD